MNLVLVTFIEGARATNFTEDLLSVSEESVGLINTDNVLLVRSFNAPVKGKTGRISRILCKDGMVFYVKGAPEHFWHKLSKKASGDLTE